MNHMYRTPDVGYEADMKRSTYYEENSCLNVHPKVPCRQIPYPLENIPSCKHPCKNLSVNSMYNDTVPAELYGDALAMNEGTGLFYYHDSTPYPLGVLSVPPHPQPYHHHDVHHS